MDRKPVFLLAGGRGRKRGERAILSAAIASAGKPAPSLAYVGAAAGDSTPFRILISGFLKPAGAGRIVPVKLCGRRPDVAGAKAVLDGADAVFVSGGDVEGGMRVLEDTGVAGHFRSLAEEGKPFIGLSAGSIMLARSWIRWTDPQDDASAELFPCLAIAPVYCDTHDEAFGWSELKALLGLLPEGGEGWGIPFGGALIAGEEAIRWMGPLPARFKRVHGSIQEVPAQDAGAGQAP